MRISLPSLRWHSASLHSAAIEIHDVYSALEICIVFVPIFLLGGVAYYLFFAVGYGGGLCHARFIYIVPHGGANDGEFLAQRRAPSAAEAKSIRRDWFMHIHEGFNHGFEKLRNFYVARLEWALNHARLVVGISLGIALLSLVILVPFLGEDFSPLVDAGQFRLHVRAPVGTRIEETQHVFTQVEDVIRSVIPKNEIDLVVANIGLPMNLNLALSDTATISSADGEILVSPNQQKHGPTGDYVKRIRPGTDR
jgi:multidrug efflux pump subunit AcrB